MTRFSLFQAVSAYTNTGISLVDQSLIPFQKAYLMIIFMIFLILTGNTAFVSLSVNLFRIHFPYFFPHFQPILYVTKVALLPLCLSVSLQKLASLDASIFTDFTASTFSNHCASSWCISKVIRKNSRLHETLQFLLAHPRRCFVYLFPSHQTWFLLTIVLGLT
jgi:Trk-type K+ transport system membrane component